MKAAHTIESSTGLNKKTGTILGVLFFILVAMVVGFILVNQVQNPSKRADEGDQGISLSGPSCPANGFICSWTRQPGVTYHYAIKDNAGAIVKEGDIPASSSSDKITVTYTPESGKTYTCSVNAKNECGTAFDEESATCSSSPQPSLIPSSTPTETPVLSPSVTPTGTISPTLSPTVTLTVTPTSALSSTPSPTLPPNVTPSKTPTPTDIVIVNTTNTPNPSQPTSAPQVTSNPTLPSSGGLPSLSMLTIILVGFGIVTLGLLL